MWLKLNKYLCALLICSSLHAMEGGWADAEIDKSLLTFDGQRRSYFSELLKDQRVCIGRRRMLEIKALVDLEPELCLVFKVLRGDNVAKIVNLAARDDADFQRVLEMTGGSTADLRAEIWEQYLTGSVTGFVKVNLVRMRTYEHDARIEILAHDSRTECCSIDGIFTRAERSILLCGVYALERAQDELARISGESS